MYHNIHKQVITRKFNALHKNFQITLENVDGIGELAFLGMNNRKQGK